MAISIALRTACVGVAMVISAPIHAQTPGLIMGYTGSDQSAQEGRWYRTYDFEASSHATAGLLLSFDAGFWRWEPRVNYTFKGRENALNLYYVTQYQTKEVGVYDQLEYLSLQSDFHLKFPLGNASFYALCAPRLDVLLDQETGISWDGNYDLIPPHPQLSQYSPTVFGVALGMGQDIQVGRHTMFLEARYDWDLEEAWQFQVAPPYSENSSVASGPVYNRTLLLQIGVRLWTNERKYVEPVWPPADSP